MFKKSVPITIIFILSTCIQLISQIVITRLFGAKTSLEIFLAAVTVPTIAVTVIYGTLNDAFLPFFGSKKIQDPSAAEDYFYTTFVVLTTLSILCALFISILTLPISLVLFAARGTEFVQEVSVQMRYMTLAIPLSVVATLFGTYFYTQKQFIRFPIAQCIGSAANIILIVLLIPMFGTLSLVIAFVATIFIQILFVLPGSLVQFRFRKVNVLPLIYAWIPLIIGNIALRSDTILIRSFATYLPEGYIIYLNLISKIFALSTSVMTIGIQITLLPHLVEFFEQKKINEAVSHVNKSKITAIMVAVTITFLIILISPMVIQFLFVGGKFTAQDAQHVIALLPFFVLPAIGWGINGVFFQPLIALHKQFQLGILNVIALLCGWVAASITISIGPLFAISFGLIILLFTGIIGSELLWQYYKKKLLQT